MYIYVLILILKCTFTFLIDSIEKAVTSKQTVVI